MLSTNIFRKIIDRTIPADIVYEDADVLAFRDIHPQAPTHLVIIPKREIPTHADLVEADLVVVGRMHWAAHNLAKQLGLVDGYRLVLNCQEHGGQTVPHLHMHLLGGRHLGWPPG